MRWNKPLAAVLLWVPVVLASAQASPEAPQPQAPLVHKKKYAMGTVFEIVAYGEFADAGVRRHRSGACMKSSGSTM